MLTDDMQVDVHHIFAAAADRVWDLLSDVEQMAGLGPEHVSARWADERRGLGARFTGVNQVGAHRWEVPCTVIASERPHTFAWVVGPVATPSSTWTYLLESSADGTLVRQTFVHGPYFSFVRASVAARPEDEEEIVAERVAGLTANMTAVLRAADRLLHG